MNTYGDEDQAQEPPIPAGKAAHQPPPREGPTTGRASHSPPIHRDGGLRAVDKPLRPNQDGGQALPAPKPQAPHGDQQDRPGRVLKDSVGQQDSPLRSVQRHTPEHGDRDTARTTERLQGREDRPCAEHVHGQHVQLPRTNTGNSHSRGARAEPYEHRYSNSLRLYTDILQNDTWPDTEHQEPVVHRCSARPRNTG